MHKKIKWARARLLIWLTHRMALPVLRYIRRPERFPYTVEELDRFPKGSLGKELILFLEERKLALLPYYARHDLKHILLEYDTTDKGEGCLQCFMLGNGHVSFPVLATVLYGWLTMPEYWAFFRKAFRRGRRSSPIARWKWFELLDQSTEALRGKIGFTDSLGSQQKCPLCFR